MQALRILNPNVARLASVENLLKASFSLSTYPPWEVLRPHVAEYLFQPHVGFFLAFDKSGEPRGVSIVLLPQSPLETTPQVANFYSEGPKALTRELIRATVDFIKESGYTTFWAINHSKMDDPTWVKALKPKDWSIERVASIMEFKHG